MHCKRKTSIQFYLLSLSFNRYNHWMNLTEILLFLLSLSLSLSPILVHMLMHFCQAVDQIYWMLHCLDLVGWIDFFSAIFHLGRRGWTSFLFFLERSVVQPDINVFLFPFSPLLQPSSTCSGASFRELLFLQTSEESKKISHVLFLHYAAAAGR